MVGLYSLHIVVYARKVSLFMPEMKAGASEPGAAAVGRATVAAGVVVTAAVVVAAVVVAAAVVVVTAVAAAAVVSAVTAIPSLLRTATCSPSSADRVCCSESGFSQTKRPVEALQVKQPARRSSVTAEVGMRDSIRVLCFMYVVLLLREISIIAQYIVSLNPKKVKE